MRVAKPRPREPFGHRSESLGYQINLLARLMAQLLGQRIAPYGVAPGQFAQLLALFDSDGQTASELSRAIGIEPGTMTRTLRRMERDGLVERRPDPRDRRASRIHLTAKARALEPELKAAAAQVSQVVLAGIGRSRARDLLEALATSVSNAEGALDRDL
jgi:DNA-binding MarR family transcriptional regulator